MLLILLPWGLDTVAKAPYPGVKTLGALGFEKICDIKSKQETAGAMTDGEHKGTLRLGCINCSLACHFVVNCSFIKCTALWYF